MSLLDRFRTRHKWEDPDPEVRAEGARELGAGEQDLLATLASSDPDARVRRAATKRLVSSKALASCLADSDAGGREEAGQALLMAQGDDSALAAEALSHLSDPRQLVGLARSAPLAEVRKAALGRLSDSRSLAAVAKLAGEPGIRLEALRRLDDAEQLLEVACK